MLKLILASSSPSRQKQLAQLGIHFDIVSPDIDESPLAGESTDDMVIRLAKAKACKVASEFPNHWIIACDQLAEFKGKKYGKPYTHEKALSVLNEFSGNTVISKTGICIMNKSTNQTIAAIEPFLVHFRKFSNREAEMYLRTEQPYFSAGSINVDGLGVTLIEKFEGNDYNSVIGLPLVKLIDLFHEAGISILQSTCESTSSKGTSIINGAS